MQIANVPPRPGGSHTTRRQHHSTLMRCVTASGTSTFNARRLPVAGDHIRSLRHAQVDTINDKFAEARDEIEYANEDAESTYFDESYKAAEAATNEARPRVC